MVTNGHAFNVQPKPIDSMRPLKGGVAVPLPRTAVELMPKADFRLRPVGEKIGIGFLKSVPFLDISYLVVSDIPIELNNLT